MTFQRKLLKKELHRLKSFRSQLPVLIDCSDIYGDLSWTKEDVIETDTQIEEIEDKIHG
jgi:hypothetical protein